MRHRCISSGTQCRKSWSSMRFSFLRCWHVFFLWHPPSIADSYFSGCGMSQFCGSTVCFRATSWKYCSIIMCTSISLCKKCCVMDTCPLSCYGQVLWHEHLALCCTTWKCRINGTSVMPHRQCWHVYTFFLMMCTSDVIWFCALCWTLHT